MKLRRTLKFHHLKRGRVRMNWNKYNLYNLSKVEKTVPNFIRKTFFQQKWIAKALTRAYHGEHIKERKWERMFSRRMLSVINMDPVYMAYNDGSEQAAGRGSGRDKPTFEDVTPWHERGQMRKKTGTGGLVQHGQLDEVDVDTNPRNSRKETNVQQFDGRTPYMNMTYAPLERRIDTAIFRAMFASSARQARQAVVHGAVKVNGQVMRHPNYLLNPGDMFQVDPDCVLFATGRKKIPPPPQRQRRGAARSSEDADGKGEGAVEESSEVETEAVGEGEAPAEAPAAENPMVKNPEDLPRLLRFLSVFAKSMLKDQKDDLKVKKKQEFRTFIKVSRKALARAGRDAEAVASDQTVVDEINGMLRELIIDDPKMAKKAIESGADAEAVAAITAEEQQAREKEQGQDKKPQPKKHEPGPLSDREAEMMNQLLEEWVENPIDETKRYATPWQPRRYMSAFAFIPRYLEVNQNICAAVYLRHPVARQRYAEVPSPFPPHVMQLAFNWYLRRR